MHRNRKTSVCFIYSNGNVCNPIVISALMNEMEPNASWKCILFYARFSFQRFNIHPRAPWYFSHLNDLSYALKTAIDLLDANMQTNTASYARTINNLKFKFEGPGWLPRNTNCCINDIFIRHTIYILIPTPFASLMTAMYFTDTFNIRHIHLAFRAYKKCTKIQTIPNHNVYLMCYMKTRTLFLCWVLRVHNTQHCPSQGRTGAI